MNYPENLKYTKDHEWILTEGNTGTVGITAHAAGELGDVVYIDIPNESAQLSLGDTFGTIEAVKTVADMFAPVSGKIIKVNSALNDHPEVVNTDPYGEGWMIKMEISNPAELNDLLDAKAYKELIGE